MRFINFPFDVICHVHLSAAGSSSLWPVRLPLLPESFTSVVYTYVCVGGNIFTKVYTNVLLIKWFV